MLQEAPKQVMRGALRHRIDKNKAQLMREPEMGMTKNK